VSLPRARRVVRDLSSLSSRQTHEHT
jgi:hypothetical protein